MIPDQHVDELSDYEQLSASTYFFLMMIIKYSTYKNSFLSSNYNTYIVPVLKFIRNHYREPLTVQTLAEEVYISLQYLRRLFVKYLGISPYQYLKNYRLNRAKELFQSNKSLKIEIVCERIGFSDTSRFIQSFKSETGLTPNQYKKQLNLQTTLYAPHSAEK